jgi:hypothetical protein
MGKPVVLPSILPPEMQAKVNKSWEIYAINEFVSNLIPLVSQKFIFIVNSLSI